MDVQMERCMVLAPLAADRLMAGWTAARMDRGWRGTDWWTDEGRTGAWTDGRMGQMEWCIVLALLAADAGQTEGKRIGLSDGRTAGQSQFVYKTTFQKLFNYNPLRIHFLAKILRFQ